MTRHGYLCVCVWPAAAFLLYTALAVQGHCCSQRRASSGASRSSTKPLRRCCQPRYTSKGPNALAERRVSCGLHAGAATAGPCGVSIELTSSSSGADAEAEGRGGDNSGGGGGELRQSLIDEEDDWGRTDSAGSRSGGGGGGGRCGCCSRRNLVAKVTRMSDEEKVGTSLLLIYCSVTVFQLLMFLLALWQWAANDGLRHSSGGSDSPPCGDPLVGNYAPCALPFPSDYLLEEDSPSATGYRVAMTSESLPLSRWDGALSPAAWNAQDGFSTVSPVLFTFGKGPIDASSLISHGEIAVSLDPSNHAMTTILLDAESGEMIPHWVDIDQYHLNYGEDTAEDGRPPLLILQPAKPLKHNTRYIVGVRRLTVKGVGVAAEPAFGAVRDCIPPGCNPTAQLSKLQPSIAWPKERTAKYNQLVFPKLEAAGFHRSHLQLAWWYKTVSAESSLGVAKHIRDQSLASVPLHGQPLPTGQKEAIEPVVDKVVDYACKPGGDTTGHDGSWGGAHGVHIGRTVWGHFMAPTYLRRPGPGYQTFYNFPRQNQKESPLDSRKDPAGHSVGGPWWSHDETDLGGGPGQRSSGAGARAMPTRLADQEERVGWVARIPCSVLQPTGNAAAAFLLQYGHGLFGSRDEINSGFLSKIANENGWILVALDWAGMAQVDVRHPKLVIFRAWHSSSLVLSHLSRHTLQTYAILLS